MTDALQIIRDKLDGTGIEFTADGSVIHINYHDLEEFLELFSNFDRDDVKPVSIDAVEFLMYVEGVKVIVRAEPSIIL